MAHEATVANDVIVASCAGGITPALLLTGMACGLAVAVVGGTLAAVHAAHVPVADAFRMA